MALTLSSDTLETRLTSLDSGVTQKLAQSLKAWERSQIVSAYHKHDLVGRIVHYFQRRDIQFGENCDDASEYLYGAFNKEPLKTAEFGMRVKGIPPEFLSRLDDFEKMYFFAGVDKIREAPGTIQSMDAYEIASIYIRAGIDNMAHAHNSILTSNARRRTVKRGYRIETYQHRWNPPHSSEVRGRLLTLREVRDRIEARYDQTALDFDALRTQLGATALPASGGQTNLFGPDLANVDERAGMFLDSLPVPARAFLTRRYSAHALGEYAVK